MLNLVVAVLVATVPFVNRAGYTIDGKSPVVAHHNVKLIPDSSVVIGAEPDGDGWRVMAPQYQRNLLCIAPDTLAVIWAPYSGDTTGEFFLGAKVSYSFDGGATWTNYDLDATNLHHRLYPSAYFDKGTNTPWFAWMENSSTNGLHIYVAYDAAFPFGVFTTSEITYNTDSLYPYLPNIVADGDDVSVIAIDLSGGHIAWWKSTDHGATWTEDFQTLTNLFGSDYDTPFQLYQDGRLFVVAASANDSVMRFAYSDDFGSTWNGPFDLALPIDSQFSSYSWWDNYDAILDNAGNLHIVAGLNFSVIYHAMYDFSTGDWTTPTLIDGDPLAGIDTLNFHPQAMTPSMAIDNNGDIYAVYTLYDTLTVNDTLYASGEAKVAKLNADGSWTILGYLDGSFDAADLNSFVWGETSYHIINNGDNLVIPYVWVDDAAGDNTFYFYGSKALAKVKESRNAFTPFVVRPSIVNGNGVIQFATVKSGNVSIDIYSQDGRLVKNVFNGTVNAGEHRVRFNTSNLPNGVYFVNFKDSRGSFSHKIIVR